jgi:ectoine hydroxylase-related dioxygenase (phytanoyl-CoA dioxygenase family)
MTTQFDRDLYCLPCSGFAILPRLVDSQRVDAIARRAGEFEEEVAEFVDAGGDAILRHNWPLRTTRCLYAIVPEIQDLVMDTAVQYARAYLGQPVLRDCLIQTNMPDTRNAGRGLQSDVSYHRDTLWPSDVIRPMYMHIFLLLSDFTRDNGATIVVPGTHKVREPGYYFKQTDPRAPQEGINYRLYEREYFPSSVQLEAPCGSLVLLDPMAIHTQGNNVLQERRSLLNMTFRAADIAGTPPLLNARAIAERFARVPMRPEFLDLLEANPALPAHFGPLGNKLPEPAISR